MCSHTDFEYTLLSLNTYKLHGIQFNARVESHGLVPEEMLQLAQIGM